jgi:hypothetical protein
MSHRGLPDEVGFGSDLLEKQSTNKYTPQENAFSVSYLGKLTPMSVLNDNKKLSFEQIADIIEKKVPTHR